MAASFAAVTALATRVAAAPLAGGAASIGGGAAVVEPARRSDSIVVVYREVLGEIGGDDRGPTLTIFGDGRMVAHYPIYMKRRGDWEKRLTPAELDALLRSLATKGVLEFDAPATKTATRAARMSTRQRALATGEPIEIFEAVDASTTVIEMALDRYVPATPGAREVRNVSKRAAWTALRDDARRHPEIPALRGLAAAEDELRALRDRPGFTRVR